MPLYDFECPVCGREFEGVARVKDRNDVTCPHCYTRANIVIKKAPGLDWFKPHWNDMFDLDPIYVETKQQYKNLCLKYDVTSRALGDIRNITEI